MSRLSNTLRLDSRLQARNKVYVIVAVAASGLALAVRAVVTPEQLHFFMPLLVMYGVSLTTVFLVGVLLLIERGEGTLDVVMVSPLRPTEYLASKLITLTALALVGIVSNRVMIDKALTVMAVDPDPTKTLIVGHGPNGSGAVRCAYLGAGSRLAGFTLTNGAA